MTTQRQRDHDTEMARRPVRVLHGYVAESIADPDRVFVMCHVCTRSIEAGSVAEVLAFIKNHSDSDTAEDHEENEYLAENG